MSKIFVTSQGIMRIPYLGRLLGEEMILYRWSASSQPAHAVAGWGRRGSSERAQWLAARLGLSYWSLEDGFLRSFNTGEHTPPLSIVLDHVGIYFDSSRPSELENMLNLHANLREGLEEDVQVAMHLIRQHRLSKYNHMQELSDQKLRPHDAERVLVIDQTFGDMSVALGGADAYTFRRMLDAALTECPSATVYVKAHPEVSSGRKGGYLSSVQDNTRTVMLRDPVNPLSLIEKMDRVYVVTSTMGFEALLAGKPVTCFGIPWYSGWGVTDDRQLCPRRTRRRTVDELFAAAYFHYARYLNPVTHQRGTIFDVIDWLIRQRWVAFPQSS